jgi:hypothetical protein
MPHQIGLQIDSENKDTTITKDLRCHYIIGGCKNHLLQQILIEFILYTLYYFFFFFFSEKKVHGSHLFTFFKLKNYPL